jgi:nickel-dependent lactate racemase
VQSADSAQIMRTGAWYGDRTISLRFPHDWEVKFHWPRTPAPLRDEEIRIGLGRSIGQQSLNEICKGKSKPLIIVDDLNRPTPAARIMPFLLRIFRHAGVTLPGVRILMALGAHGPPQPGAMVKKIGAEAASICQTLVHNCNQEPVKVGSTSFGTVVLVNRAVISSDLVIGIGGIYPNLTAGFGGGSKLALGVLGKRSIMQLHFSHKGAGWGNSVENDFRRDVDEIAHMIGLSTVVTLHVNADREVVRMACGDHFRYYADEVAFVRDRYSAELPDSADIVISNAFPVDTSLTFAWMKGITPLRHCAPGAVRIAIAACSEGVGHHQLFPLSDVGILSQLHTRAHRVRVMGPRETLVRLSAHLTQSFQAVLNRHNRKLRSEVGPVKTPILLYRLGHHPDAFSTLISGLRLIPSWSEMLHVAGAKTLARNPIVHVYPCAPLQHFAGAQSLEENLNLKLKYEEQH